ncbi:hypothetical protein E4T56_gene1483 [Termitomyces sp. T112]|nr:hypothetical protein E4T56_gene1483 [Termitomyces sp. T112]
MLTSSPPAFGLGLERAPADLMRRPPHPTKDAIPPSYFFWPRVGEFFRPKDIIVTETSSPNFAIPDIPLPKGSILVSQLLWGSIGWSVGSLLGASLAARTKGLGRCILFIGNGSIQLSVQELSTMLWVGVTPIIFLVNNRIPLNVTFEE